MSKSFQPFKQFTPSFILPPGGEENWRIDAVQRFEPLKEF